MYKEAYNKLMEEYCRLSDTDLENIKEDVNVSEICVMVASAVLGARRSGKKSDKGRNPVEPM